MGKLGQVIGEMLVASKLDGATPGLNVTVNGGRAARRDSPVRLEFPARSLPSALAELLGRSPGKLQAREVGAAGGDSGPASVQVDQADTPGGPVTRLTWVVAGDLPAGTARTFRVEAAEADTSNGPWLIHEEPPGLLDVKNRERTVFRYNMAPSSHPNYPPIQTRSAYIHPAFTPTGALITGDFSKFHPHHRGFFLAYTKTQAGTLHPDFWNIHTGSGKIYFERLERAVAGPVTAGFTTHHRWEARGSQTVLRERWDIELYDIAGQPYWLFDLTSTQQAVGQPLELLPYRYGGMAYRGADPFVRGGIDVLTSEGRGRRQRDQKPARWVDLTGPISDGSAEFAGAMIADHPANINHPTVARIHPVLLPFFCYVPAHDKKVTIGTDAPTIFRYRILIHDGHPDGALNERVWRDFAEPPQVTLADT